jgi:alpha-N-arabinofuranosidase
MMKKSLLTLLLLVSLSVLSQDKINAVIQTDDEIANIHPYTYGMFTELLGNIFDHGLWAEMLSDRKFFYPVDTTTTFDPPNTRGKQNKWYPIGGVNAVTMSTEKSFVGEMTPIVQLSGQTKKGFAQRGMGVKQGVSYSGYIWLAGENASVDVTLSWGKGEVSKTFNNLSESYSKYAFEFTAEGSSKDAELKITGTGNGSFKVGAVSLMPADHLDGWRADLVAKLKELNSGIYRWPGGNMLAGYDWRDGIGAIDTRPPMYDYAWDAVESNDVGTPEFIRLCELTEVDPYFVVNIGFGDAYSAAQWVEYVNGDPSTPMGKLRASHGYEQPWDVAWWGVGNEMYGQWQLGHMSIDHYILKHNYFVDEMKAVDPTIKIIGCGANPFETSTTARHHKYPIPGPLPYEFGSDADWTGKLLAGAKGLDYVAEHLYPVTNMAFDAEQQKFIATDDPIIDQARRVPNRIKAIAESWDRYVEMMPELKNSDITFALDEWTGGGWGSGFLRTLCAAEGMHEIFRQADVITMGGYTAITSTVRFNDTDATYTAIGLMFDIFEAHHGNIALTVSGNSPQKEVKGTKGVDKPFETSGSPTYPLDVMATKDANGAFITVSIINPTDQNKELTVEGLPNIGNVEAYKIIPPELMSMNMPGEEPVIEVTEEQLKRAPKSIQVAPYEISMYKFYVK